MSYAAPIFPLDYIGPSPYGSGGGFYMSNDEEDYTKIDGPKIKPSPMIPPEIDISEECMKRLSKYLDSEISVCNSERWSHIDKFSRLKQKYRTKFPEFPKNFPIPNSSQITIPIIKTNVDTLTSRLHQTVMAAEPLASVRTKDPVFQDFAGDWEIFLKLYSEEKMDMEDVLDTAITESIKLGTSVVETTRALVKRKVVKYDALGGKYQQEVKELYNGPICYNIPIEDFWIRPEWQDVQKAPWCGKVVRVSWSEIKDMALSGELNPDKINEIWKLPVSPGDVPSTVTDQDKEEKTEPQFWQEYRLFELCVRWDVDGDGIDEELLVYYHWESRTILRIKFNTFKNGQRPYDVFRYKKIEYRFYGEGMAEILEQLQEEISTQHNQRLDNATIAALKLILTGKSIKGLRPGDPLWGGKIIRTGGQNPGQDVTAFTLGEIYPSTRENELLSQSYVQQVSGIGETAMGNAQPVSRTTAAAQLSLLEELNRRFDKTLRGYRKCIRSIYNRVTDLFNQSGTNGLSLMWLGDIRGEQLESYITMPADALASKIKIQVTSTKATVNREVEMQTNIALMNLIIQNGQLLLSLVQGIAPQSLPTVVRLLLESITPVYKKVLQYADSADPEQAIKVLAFVESILPSPEDMGGMQQQAGMAAAGATSASQPGPGAPAPGGPSANGNGTGPTQAGSATARMADIMQALGATNGGKPRVAGRGR